MNYLLDLCSVDRSYRHSFSIDNYLTPNKQRFALLLLTSFIPCVAVLRWCDIAWKVSLFAPLILTIGAKYLLDKAKPLPLIQPKATLLTQPQGEVRLPDTDTEEARLDRKRIFLDPNSGKAKGDQLKIVFDQNTQIFKKGHYIKNGKKIPVKVDEIYNCKIVKATTTLTADKPFPQCKIDVLEGDCVTIYKQLKDQGLNPVLLDAANASSPGGHPQYARAQEERICRSSTLYQTLSKCKEDQMYPIPEDAALYAKNVHVFRGTQDEAYPLFDKKEQFTMSVVVCAALNLRSKNWKKEFPVKLNEETKKFEPQSWDDGKQKKYKELVLAKLRAIYTAALKNQHDSLVLMPFGCGAFKNPQDLIIKYINSVHQEFQGCFKKVVCAVINDHNGEQNVEIFKELEENKLESVQ